MVKQNVQWAKVLYLRSLIPDTPAVYRVTAMAILCVDVVARGKNYLQGVIVIIVFGAVKI